MKWTEEQYRELCRQHGCTREPAELAAKRKREARKKAARESAGERSLAARLEEIPELAGYHREYEFSPQRRWRLDFAWPAQRVAVEVESSVHRTKTRFGGDLVKYNAAALAGWLLLRSDRKMIESGKAVETIRAALERRSER